MVGADSQFFTLFQFFGPVAGAFLGPVVGIVSVLFAQLADFFIVGKEWQLINVIRLLPMLFAAYYFGSKKKYLGAIIPIICMALFIAHPVGREAWFFSLYWFIPIFGKVLPDKAPGKLIFRSLGATFTAHAIGSTIWLYTVPMPATAWAALIPIVLYERVLFAAGIAVSYVVMNTVLDKVAQKVSIPLSAVRIDKRYVLSRRMLKTR